MHLKMLLQYAGLFVNFLGPSLDGSYYAMALSVHPPICPVVTHKKHRRTWQIFSCDQAAIWLVQSVRPSEPLPRKIMELLKKFNNTSRFIDDLATLNNDGYLQQFKERIYPKELVLNQENKEGNRATFLDLEAHIKDGKFCTKTYDKWEAFNFEIVNYPDLSGNIPERPAYGIYISQVIRYAKICNQTKDFIDWIRLLFNKLRKKHLSKWRNVAGRTLGLWINTTMGWTIIWPMIVGALIHEAGTVIQAPKPVCQFMAEDFPPPVLNPYPTTSINSTSHKVPSQPSSQD